MDEGSKLRSRRPVRSSTSKYHRRNIYISKEDLLTWSQADIFCENNDVSISSLIAAALANFLEKDRSSHTRVL